MKSIKLLIIILAFSSANVKAQGIEIRYAIETTFNDSTPVAYEQNYGSLQYNSTTSDLVFTTNLADFKTGNKKIDSLLAEKEKIQFTFQGNLGENLFGMISQENNNVYNKINGTVLVNNISYPVYAYFKAENFSDKSNTNKALLDLKFEINPKIIKIPYLSDYFNNVLLFQINDGIILK